MELQSRYRCCGEERILCVGRQWNVAMMYLILKKVHAVHGVTFLPPTLVAARSKARVYGRLIAGVADSNPAGGLNVCLLRVLCVVS